MLPFAKAHTKSLFPFTKANFSSHPASMQKIIMMCGPPGVGKGTYSRLLADDFGYVKISTGDEIRKVLNNESKKNTTNYQPSELTSATLTRLRRYMRAGKLVPDEVIMEILYHKIREPASARGVILDGFPRTVNQLNLFSQIFSIHLVINIQQSHEYLMASLLGRRTCMSCGVSYSAESFYKDGYELDIQMPKKEGVCDHCGGHVKTRDDDKKEIILARLKEYETKTLPVLQHAQTKGGLVIDFEAKRGVRDYPKLQQIIVSRLGLPFYYHHFQNPEFSSPLIYN